MVNIGPQQRKVLRDLRRARLLFIAVVALLTFGIGMFIAIYSAFQNLSASESALYEETRFADALFSLQPTSTDAVDAARQVAGVESAQGRTVQDMPVRKPGDTSATVTGRLISLPDAGHPLANDVVVRQGQYPADGDTASVLVDDQFAGVYGLGPGDSIELIVDDNPQALQIAGTFVSPEYVWKAESPQRLFVGKGDFAVIMARHGLFDGMLQTGDRINEVAVRYAQGADKGTVTVAVQRALTPFGLEQVTLRGDQISYALLKLDLDGFNRIGVVAPALFLIISALVIYALLSRTVQAQRSLIGMMRAVGFSRGQVLRHFLTFSIIIAILGGVLGALVGLGLGWYVSRLYADVIGIPTLRIQVHWPVLVISLAVGFVVCVAAGAGPALAASRLAPFEAMRPSPPSTHRSILVEWLIRSLRPTFIVRLAVRNLVRVRGRTVSSILGIAMAVALVVASIGMLDSMDHGLSVQFDQTERYDLKVTFVQPFAEQGLPDYASWEPVSVVEPVIELPVTLTHGGVSESALLTGVPGGAQLLRLQRVKGSEPLAADGLFLSSGMASQLGAGIGDTVLVNLGTRSTALPLAGTVALPLASGAYVRASVANALSGTGEPQVTGVLFKLRSPSDEAQVREMIAAQPGVLTIETPGAERQSFEQLMGLFYEFAGIFVLFGIPLGAIAVFNTVMINVIERRQELATMRMLGFGKRTVDGLLTVETLLTGVVGTLLGLALGYALEIGLLSLFKSSLFDLPVYVAPRTYAIVGVGALALLLLSQSPGLRTLHRLDLAAVTKERAS